MNGISAKGHHGFTVIEMLLVLSAFTIFLAFAVPSFHNSSARAEMKEATDQVAQAFRTAKNVARLTNSTVTMTLTTNRPGDNSISFVFDDTGTNNIDIDIEGSTGKKMTLPGIVLPARVALMGDTSVFSYDALGMVNTTGTITLASTSIPHYTSTVVVNDLMGRVIVDYAAHDAADS